MFESEVDMDELEARLYGQVHYMPSDYDNFTPPSTVPNTQHVKTFKRYFDKAQPQHLNTPNFAPPNESTTPSSTTRNIDCDRVGVYPVPVVGSPINNIVVLPPPPTQIYTHQQNSDKWLERLLRQYKKANLKNKRKRSKKRARLISQREEKQYNKFKNAIISSKKPSQVNQVKIEDVCVISDDDKNSSIDSNDVILVETKSEIIDIDCEEPKPAISPILTENFDMESTTSNDFLDNTIIPNVKQSTPRKKTDNCETGSGYSSTVDYTENFKGSTSDSKNLNRPTNSTFSELNLDSFTNYIGSSGKKSEDILPLKSSLLVNKLKQVSKQRKSSSTSDSSSESEYDSNAENKSKHSEEIDVVDNPNLELGDIIKIDDSQTDLQPETEDLIIVDDTKNESEIQVIEIDETTEEQHEHLIFIDDEKSNSGVEELNSDLMLNVEGINNDIANNQSSTNSKRESFSKYWTEDMNKFYTESWGQENYSVIDEQRQMSDDPSMWKIIAKDRINPDFRKNEPRCRRCREFGHISIKCTKKLAPVKCVICGGYGHSEPRCPKKLCTSCGIKNSFFTTFCSRCAHMRFVKCSTCNMTGHRFAHCPDLWRRYLFTTKEGQLQQPLVNDLKKVEDRWCSGCGLNGHFEPQCYYYNRSHAPVSLLIHSYQDVYEREGTSNKVSFNNTPTSTQTSTETRQQTPNKSMSKETFKHPSTSEKNHTGNDTNLIGKESWYNNDPMYRELLTSTAKSFLPILKEKMSVSIGVTRKSRNEIICHFKGSTENIAQAKAAITRYCVAVDSTQNSKNNAFVFNTTFKAFECLERNLNVLNDVNINWLSKAKRLFSHITELTSSMNDFVKTKVFRRKQVKLKKSYQQLNAIIIGKLKIGDDKTHMENLEQSLETQKIALYSFDYVFNSDHRLYTNYEELISKLPTASTGAQNKSLVIKVEQLKLSTVKTCSLNEMRPKVKKLFRLYADVIISNYSNKNVTVFLQQCVKLKEMCDALRKEKQLAKIAKKQNKTLVS